MQINIYTVYDAKARAFMTPFFMSNDAMAERAFYDMMTDERQAWHKHKEDYALYLVGNYDDQNAQIESDVIQLMTGASIIQPEKKKLETVDRVQEEDN